MSTSSSGEMATLQRFHVHAEALVPRPVEVVWGERDSSGHPAWGHQSWSSIPLAGGTGCQVGAGAVSIIPATGSDGLRKVWLSQVTHVMPGFSVTVETITPHLEQMETIQFPDAGEGQTRLTIDSYFTTVSTLETVDRLTPGFQRLAQEYLDRVANWTPPSP